MRGVTIHEAGGPITVQDREVRAAGPGEIRLRVGAAAVNPIDTLMWRTFAPAGPQSSLTPGMDAAGTVESIGPDVDRLSAGDAVMAAINARLPEGGGQAELVVVPASSVVPIPDGLAPIAASALPMNGLTALEGLRLLDLPPGATLAVTGGAGQLASYAIPLAKRQGLVVIADAKPEDEALVAGFGADQVVSRGGGFAAEVRRLVPEGVDAVFDTALLTRAALPAVRDGGGIAVVRGWDNGAGPERGVRVLPVRVTTALPNTDWLELISAEAAAGRLVPRIAGTYPPERAQEAYERMDAGGLRGRLVITF
ncbi:NADPH:quinone reductase-like Zn-dependent oxidoreductase [Amycolatopsis sulphurea]|uniref:NADPH:quinone reductase-like Zn-dependent oxidoreductase n=1 Tax=Amycolatopsis sulphurea TaxID=76022 RepID=A0A2A9FGD2_9PSEU|nr:NADP-dependent oxidoreductase [Amycolatopsis sulphurea]PFG49983.1 NADPH:quinone reductase-like Zn-dependent oxidoreductase [Amycolatopsis sulphurea]